MTTGTRSVPVWQDQIRLRVLSKGHGPPLIFFHGPWGLTWDRFLDELARTFTVHAPEHPGTSPGRPDDIYPLDGVWDLVSCYQELLDGLELTRPALVGHSFGAMVACEVAVAAPHWAGHLVLMDALGLWRDDTPITNWMLMTHTELASHVFLDAEGEAARRMFEPPEDPEARVLARVGRQWAMGATGKFLWPIPDKGLRKRIHRVQAPTLLVWGKDDRLVPPVYADEFARRIPGTRVEIVEQTGHAPHLEQPETVARLIRDFVRA